MAVNEPTKGDTSTSKTGVMAIGQKAVGETVKIDVGGTATEFIVVHQGNPDPALYDISCTGTWLLAKDCLAEGPWAATNTNAYLKCIALTALKDVVKKFPAAVVQQFKMAKIPYCAGGGGSTVNSGTNGMATKMFLLSEYEVGYTNSISSYIPVDGAKLDYFDSGNGGSSKRIANYNGSALGWWTRSPLTVSNYQSWRITNEGFGGGESTSGYHGIRPAFIMPFNAAVSEDGYLTGGTQPVKLGSLAIGTQLPITYQGKKRNFIIVNQGNPDATMYDSSCNGTWLLLKTPFQKAFWGNDDSYSKSVCAVEIGQQHKNMLDTEVQKLVKRVKIPYQETRTDALRTKADGFACDMFLLSSREIGINSPNDSTATYNASKIAYFKYGTVVPSEMISGSRWWLRNQNGMYGGTALCVDSEGKLANQACGGVELQLRPCMILPIECEIDTNGGISTGAKKVKLGELTEGSNVTLNENGSPVSFYVAKQNYESGLNGTGRTLVVRKDCYDKRRWNSENVNTYATSTIDTWLNGTYKKLLDSSIQKVMSTTKFKYILGNRNTAVGTLERSVFLLSFTELGGKNYDKPDGTVLDIASDLLIAYLNGSAIDQWTRTAASDSYSVGCLAYNGAYGGHDADNTTAGSRPAFTLPDNLAIDTTGSVVVNAAPTVTCRDGASGVKLGTKTAPWNFKYVPLDEDGDALTVKEKLDGVVKKTRTNVASGTELTFELASTAAGFQKILNGSHTITIEVSDGTETTEFTATFDKAVYKAKITLTKPLAVAGDITVAIMAMVGQIPGDAKYTIEATNNAKDANPVWQDVTSEVDNSQNIVFKNHVTTNGAAFAFRITVERGSSNTGGYISAVTGAFQ